MVIIKRDSETDVGSAALCKESCYQSVMAKKVTWHNAIMHKKRSPLLGHIC